MKKLTSHDQEIIASMVYRHQMELRKAYKEVFDKPDMNDIRQMIANWLPIDPEYRPMDGARVGIIRKAKQWLQSVKHRAAYACKRTF